MRVPSRQRKSVRWVLENPAFGWFSGESLLRVRGNVNCEGTRHSMTHQGIGSQTLLSAAVPPEASGLPPEDSVLASDLE